MARRLPPGAEGFRRGFGGDTDAPSVACGHSGHPLAISGAAFKRMPLRGGLPCVTSCPARDTRGLCGCRGSLCGPGLCSPVPPVQSSRVRWRQGPCSKHVPPWLVGKPASAVDAAGSWAPPQLRPTGPPRKVLSSVPGTPQTFASERWALSALTHSGVGAQAWRGKVMC